MSRFLGILGFVFFAFLCGCDSDVKRTLVVGTSADYPPFTFIHEKKVTGFDIDLATAISQRLGYKLIIKNMRFDEIIPAIQGNKIDFGIAAITDTNARSQLVDFSAKYHHSKLAMLYRKQHPIAPDLSLDHKTIAVQRGSTMEIFLEDRLHSSPNTRLLRFEKTHTGLVELKAGKIDCIFVELSAARVFCAKDSSLSYSFIETPSDHNYAIAFPKGSALKHEFDNAMLRLRVSDEFERLSEKWIEPVS